VTKRSLVTRGTTPSPSPPARGRACGRSSGSSRQKAEIKARRGAVHAPSSAVCPMLLTGRVPLPTVHALTLTGRVMLLTGHAPFSTGHAPFSTGRAPFFSGRAPFFAFPGTLRPARAATDRVKSRFSAIFRFSPPSGPQASRRRPRIRLTLTLGSETVATRNPTKPQSNGGLKLPRADAESVSAPTAVR